MARALSHDARIIVMDEPSAALAHDEVSNLFRIIREVTAQGVAVIYISHRLEEIREIGDRVTVLKDGRTVAVGLPAKDTPTNKVVSLMTGRNVEYVFPPRHEGGFEEELLKLENVSVPKMVRDVSFSVRAGEIVGLAGLVGSGRSEIIEAVYGARRCGGKITLNAQLIRANTTRSVRLGMGLAPEERKAQGLLLGQSIARNITLASLERYSTFGWINRKKEAEEAAHLVKALDIRAARPQPRHQDPLRRQPAEGGHRPLAGRRRPQAAAARRADPRCRRRRPRRRSTPSSASWPTKVSVYCWSPARFPRSSASPTACW